MPIIQFPAFEVEARAIIFDKDGVLQDFHGFWGAVTRSRVLGLGLDPERDSAHFFQLTALLGFPDDTVDADGPLVLATGAESAILAAGYLYAHLGLPWVEARNRVRESFEASGASVPAEALKPCAGAPDAVRALKSMGWRLGVATTDNKAHAIESLERVGMLDCFEAIVGGDEVGRGKPDPEMYHRACAQLGVRPEDTVVVGDGINDLRMGRGAGCLGTIGVLSGVSRRAQLEPEADLILDGVGQLPPLCR